ncbi:MAG: TIM barrel protein [Acidobacteria bacterium]|nr:TIM barrel protein [Acidobacteriota bacterium]
MEGVRMDGYSRRAFMGRTAAFLAGSAAGGKGILSALDVKSAADKQGVAPAGKPGGVPFRLGLASYTFREYSLEETLAMTVRLGLKRITFKDFHLPLQSSDEDIKLTVTKVRAAGLELYAGGVIYMKLPEEVQNAFRYARAAGMDIIIGVPEHDLLPLVEQKVKATGIKVAIHNHGPTDPVYPTPESAYERIKHLDGRIGLCLDIGHTQRADTDPSLSAERFADRLLDVHIKDVTSADREGGTVEIGRGVIDIPKFLRTLIRIGYDGTASFEFEKDGKDPLPGVAESVGFIRGCLSAIGVGPL